MKRTQASVFLLFVAAVFFISGFSGLGTLLAEPCPGDIDCDGTVDGTDLAGIVSDFGQTNCTQVNYFTPPIITHDAPPESNVTVITVNITISDDREIGYYIIPNNDAPVYANPGVDSVGFPIDLNLYDGMNTFYIFAWDTEGNMAKSKISINYACTDCDDDGYLSEAYGGDDCNDGNPNINPDAEEICDGDDNDCDGMTDVKSCYTGSAATEGIGICTSGLSACQSGIWSPCQDEVLPTTEICNGFDDDCDGQVDENFSQTTSCSPYGTCAYSDICDQVGSREKICRQYKCLDGKWEIVSAYYLQDPNPNACIRITTGTTCGDSYWTSWSSCGDYQDTCDEDATRYRSYIDRKCSNGQCMTYHSQDETEICKTRDTDGISCGTNKKCIHGRCESIL